MIYHDIIIVGGGASGILTAIVAKNKGKDVAIIEGTDRIGKKILTTGNGRCNISNVNISSPYNCYHSYNNHFFNNVLDQFNVANTIDLFISLGLPITELEKGKLYPESLQASSVVDILKMSLEEREIPVYTNNKVLSITEGKQFSLISSNEENNNFKCNKLVLSCGGKSAVKTGSDGSGYKLARTLGHSITSITPGIVQLKLQYPYLKSLSGIKVNGKVSLIINKKEVRSDIGEILFTDYGISGPPILQLSRDASIALNNHQEVSISLDIMHDLSLKMVEEKIIGHIYTFSNRSLSNLFIGILNKKLIPIFLKECGINNIHCAAEDLTWQQKNVLCSKLKNWEFKCIDTNGFNNAQLTVGGINTIDINPKTLESTITKNLFFTGEILDVNGDCGGFNLQWAWSSALTVGNSI